MRQTIDEFRKQLEEQHELKNRKIRTRYQRMEFAANVARTLEKHSDPEVRMSALMIVYALNAPMNTLQLLLEVNPSYRLLIPKSKSAAPTKEEMTKTQAHADADYRCGNRKWVCACAACRSTREFGWKPTQERGTLNTGFRRPGKDRDSPL